MFSIYPYGWILNALKTHKIGVWTSIKISPSSLGKRKLESSYTTSGFWCRYLSKWAIIILHLLLIWHNTSNCLQSLFHFFVLRASSNLKSDSIIQILIWGSRNISKNVLFYIIYKVELKILLIFYLYNNCNELNVNFWWRLLKNNFFKNHEKSRFCKQIK